MSIIPYRHGTTAKPFVRSHRFKADQVLFIPLCGKCVNQIEALGRSTEAPDAMDVVVVV